MEIKKSSADVQEIMNEGRLRWQTSVGSAGQDTCVDAGDVISYIIDLKGWRCDDLFQSRTGK